MANLFLVYLGGRTPKSNIELHDVQFVAGEKIEDTYEALRAQWFGTVKGLHLDSYIALKYVDGYRIELSPEQAKGEQHLYFINFGGYDPENLAELHQFGMFVAPSPDAAKAKAKQQLLVGTQEQHKDDLFDIDDCFVVASVGELYVHLHPDEHHQPFKPDWYGYKVIG
jgi:hypothetical protein